jgi:NAD-dependent dihydropyrimidine dehydrogenase PreA subunit
MGEKEGRLVAPIIDETRCDGCGLCVELCSTRALALGDGKAVIVNPEACLYEGVCEDICPQDAIARPFEVVFAP